MSPISNLLNTETVAAVNAEIASKDPILVRRLAKEAIEKRLAKKPEEGASEEEWRKWGKGFWKVMVCRDSRSLKIARAN
jgi:hypothetical protein